MNSGSMFLDCELEYPTHEKMQTPHRKGPTQELNQDLLVGSWDYYWDYIFDTKTDKKFERWICYCVFDIFS